MTTQLPAWNWYEDWFTVEEYVNSRMADAMRIKAPIGVHKMAKQVRLTAGEGDNKVEIATAVVENDPTTGLAQVLMTVTDESWIKLLGGNQVRGTMQMLPTETPEEPV